MTPFCLLACRGYGHRTAEGSLVPPRASLPVTRWSRRIGGSGWLVPGGVGSACALLSVGTINQCLSWRPLEVSGPPCIFTQAQPGTDVTQRLGVGGGRSWVPRPGASRVTSRRPSLCSPEAGCSHCPPGGHPADSFLQPPGGAP